MGVPHDNHSFYHRILPCRPHPFWRFPPQVPQVPQVPHHAISNKAVAVANLKIFLLVLNVGNGWVAGGCWDAKIDSDYGSFPNIPYV